MSNSVNTPTHIFVVHQFGFCQELFVKYDMEFAVDIRKFILDSDRKLRLYCPTYEMKTWLEGQERAVCSNRIHYWGNMLGLDRVEDNSGKVFEIKEYDKEFDFGMDLAYRFYKDKYDYLKYGKPMGVTSEDGTPAGVIYSAGYDGKRNEIDIFVAESFRGKGFAKVLTLNFCKMIKDSSEEITWDCYTNNGASRKIAEFVGFENHKEYLYYNIQPRVS